MTETLGPLTIGAVLAFKEANAPIPAGKAGWPALWAKAKAAGVAAGKAAKPEPIGHVTVAGGGRVSHFYESAGLCGFAWVTVAPGTHPFAKWLKANKLADKHWKKGVYHWVGDHDQEVDRKSAHARAMAEVLKTGLNDPALTIYADSRLD